MMVPEPTPTGVSILTTAPRTRSITWLMVGVAVGSGVVGRIEVGIGVSVGLAVGNGVGEGMAVGVGDNVAVG